MGTGTRARSGYASRMRAPAHLVMLLGLAAPGAAFASGNRARLEIAREAGATTCPDGNALSDAVAARLGYEPFASDAGSHLFVRFRRDGPVLRGSVVMRDAGGVVTGERTLQSSGDDCQELAAAVTLTVSILLDPRSGLGPRPPQLPRAPTPQETPNLSERHDPTATAEAQAQVRHGLSHDATPRVRGRLVARAAGSIGLLPSAAIGVLAGAGAEGRLWSADAELRVDAPETAGSGGREVRASFVAAGIVPCVRFGLARACGVVAAGAMRAEVTGTGPGPQSAFMMLIGPRAGASLRLAQWVALDAHADVLYAPTVMTLRVDGNNVWSTSAVSGLLGIGLVGSFP